MPVVDLFDGLLEADRNQESHADRRDVDKEVFPSVGSFMGSMNVEHGFRVFLSST